MDFFPCIVKTLVGLTIVEKLVNSISVQWDFFSFHSQNFGRAKHCRKTGKFLCNEIFFCFDRICMRSSGFSFIIKILKYLNSVLSKQNVLKYQAFLNFNTKPKKLFTRNRGIQIPNQWLTSESVTQSRSTLNRVDRWRYVKCMKNMSKYYWRIMWNPLIYEKVKRVSQCKNALKLWIKWWNEIEANWIIEDVP